MKEMNYQIVSEEERLVEFIDWLPSLQKHEKFYCVLFARKKYVESNDPRQANGQLKRFLTDKGRMLNKIRQLEIKKGTYRLFDEPVHEDALALYINPNPRDLRKASFNSIIELTKLLKEDHKSFNPHSEVMSCIQRSAGNKVYLDFDIDYKPFAVEQLDEFINRDCVQLIETRGGYHILVELKKIEKRYQSTFYEGIQSLNVDQTGDQLVPIPGCIQGGFVPRFV